MMATNYKSIRETEKAKKYIEALTRLAPLSGVKHDHTQVIEAVELCLQLKPIELAAISVFFSRAQLDATAYIEALADVDLMFETGYLRFVTGHPPYKTAEEFGLKTKDILAYQQQWIEVGLK